MAEPIGPKRADSFAANVREELGPRWKFASIAALFVIAILALPIPEGGANLTFFAVYMALVGPVHVYQARARGRAYQAAAAMVAIAAGVWIVALIWARQTLGPRAGMFDVLGLNVPIPRIELILLGALTLFVVLDIVRRLRVQQARLR